MFFWPNISRATSRLTLTGSRTFSHSTLRAQSERPKSTHPLMLMDMPRILVPNLFELIKIRLKVKFRMMQIDPSFNYSEFSKGTLQAVTTVSNMISKGDFQSLGDLVHGKAIEKIKKNYELLDSNQKKMIVVNPNDVQVQVHYMFEEAKADSSLFVKMGLLYYVVPGFYDAIQETMLDPLKQMEIRRKFQDDLIVVDYRFVREYAKDSPSDWLITELNHWAIADHEEEFKGRKPN
ncbi:Juvenile hormone esterase binding [Brachionus plicatilis]|uniref:Juvenile hormone esterase binding n=1 Tax=Brachionus plicatilis TaxID=10195 RepID=A0A3M7PU47_BRAPC|nr:Juvenile hormone esterase binding [Brachionus plicatilis]